MKTWLIDYDGTMENLALMRLSAYHKQQGDDVSLKRLANNTRRHIDWQQGCPPLWDRPDQVYISCIFRWNARNAMLLKTQWNGNAEIGGTGISIEQTLTPDVDAMIPDYDLYGETRSIGFISRGCPNRCPWCVVWRKEGIILRESTAQEIVGDRKESIFLDNNILALPGYEMDLEWLASKQVAIDFNQGIDASLITKDTARLLTACKWSRGIRLALDSKAKMKAVERAIGHLNDAGMPSSHITLFILIGFSGLKSDVERLLIARSWGVNPFPMGFRDLETGAEPARGWDRNLYKKFRRLIIRIPQGKKVWDDFEKEVKVT